MQKPIASSAEKSLREMAGVANGAGAWRTFRSITFVREVDSVMMLPKI
jgi:hypothetical protein